MFFNLCKYLFFYLQNAFISTVLAYLKTTEISREYDEYQACKVNVDDVYIIGNVN